MASYHPATGVPNTKREELYLEANRLNEFGFSGWLGPEPHGTNPRNSGSSAQIGTKGRDEVYAREVVNLISSLEKNSTNASAKPWLIVSSFINPHDIALYGDLTELSPLFNFEIDPSIPFIPPAPTADESLLTKPTAQESYKETYPKTFQPTRDTLVYLDNFIFRCTSKWIMRCLKFFVHYNNPSFTKIQSLYSLLITAIC